MPNFFTHSISLYVATILIWGSTFYAIKLQLGVVGAEVSIVYRFLLASIILLLFCLFTKRNLRFSPGQHFFIFLQGLFLFSTNYLLTYWATGLLTSGVVCLVFSTVLLMNIVNGTVFMRQSVNIRVALGVVIGVTGIAAVFWSELTALDTNHSSWRGLWICLLAAFSASLGNILSARNQLNKLPVVQTNAWGMGYGALIMMTYALLQGTSFNYDPSPAYTISLLYLSIFGSIFAFGSYLTLIGRIGADKTAYITIFFPVIALTISTIFEDYQWTFAAICGFGLVLFGNYMVLRRPAAASVKITRVV